MLGIATKIRLILIVAATVAAGVAGWTMNGWRLNAQIDRMVTEHSQALAKANKDALDRYAAMERRKQEALDEANKIAQRNAAAAASARADADRLRNDLASASGSVSTATVTSLRNYTTTVNFIFAECVREIESLAKTADGHALDSRTLIGAWPK
jgi:predicted PP-loop superfamily ATPase